MITHLVEPLVYDYSQIADASMRTLAQRAADEIKPRLRRAADDILVIGQRLAVVRQYLPHGQWKSWIETEFGMGDETARQFIRVATRFADKSLIIRDLTPTALYMLAAPSTPDEAIAEVESLVTNGYTPTVAETKQIIAEAKAPRYRAAAESSLAHLIGRTSSPTTDIDPADAPTPGKLLVDWTDEDWAGHQAEIDAAVLAVADASGSVGAKKTKLSDEEEMRIAIDWLSAYRGPHGANWSQMTDSQIHHANSPCFQAWTKAHPEVGVHKLRIKQAMYQLRRRSSILGASTTATQSPIHQITHSDDKNDLSPQNPPAPLPADEGREWVRIQGLHGVLSQMFILLTGEHRTTAEAYGFGVEYQRLLGEVESLRREVKGLTPGDKMTR